MMAQPAEETTYWPAYWALQESRGVLLLPAVFRCYLCRRRRRLHSVVTLRVQVKLGTYAQVLVIVAAA